MRIRTGSIFDKINHFMTQPSWLTRAGEIGSVLILAYVLHETSDTRFDFLLVALFTLAYAVSTAFESRRQKETHSWKWASIISLVLTLVFAMMHYSGSFDHWFIKA